MFIYAALFNKIHENSWFKHEFQPLRPDFFTILLQLRRDGLALRAAFYGLNTEKRASKQDDIIHLNKIYSMFYLCFESIDASQAPFLRAEVLRISTGSNTRLVIVPTTSVSEVSQPSALVPPKSLRQKIIKPAIRTSDV
ncbi:MAG: hypothetical protein JWQ30_1735 [Sediminibacterium sp.]|nr:hypothetical protein [Sediminibacterium sp.]